VTKTTVIGTVLLAGGFCPRLLARRIVCFVKPGDRLSTGERFGLSHLGSRLDAYLPLDVFPLVSIGQIMVAGGSQHGWHGLSLVATSDAYVSVSVSSN